MTEQPRPSEVDDETLPSGEAPLGEREPAMEGEPLEEPKTDEQGKPTVPGAGQASQA